MNRTPATMRALTRAVDASPRGTKSATPSVQFLQRYARHASSSADPAQRAVAAATQSASAAASTSHAATAMPWDAYFKLRKSRKNWGTIAAIPTTLTGVFGGGGDDDTSSRLLIALPYPVLIRRALHLPAICRLLRQSPDRPDIHHPRPGAHLRIRHCGRWMHRARLAVWSHPRRRFVAGNASGCLEEGRAHGLALPWPACAEEACGSESAERK